MVNFPAHYSHNLAKANDREQLYNDSHAYATARSYGYGTNKAYDAEVLAAPCGAFDIACTAKQEADIINNSPVVKGLQNVGKGTAQTIKNVGTGLGSAPTNVVKTIQQTAQNIHQTKLNTQKGVCAQTCGSFDVLCTTEKFIASCGGGSSSCAGLPVPCEILLLGGAAVLALIAFR